MGNENENKQNFWIGKKAKIQIKNVKGMQLNYTATIIDNDGKLLTFCDRDGIVYSFPIEAIIELKQVAQ